MKSCSSALEKLRAKALCLGASVTIAVLGVCSLPSIAASPYLLETQSNVAPEMLLARQQRSGRWIEIDLSAQRLIAWNGKTRVRSYIVSTGKRRTPTHIGTFTIQSKFRSTRMRGEDYNVPNVPYAMYYSGGYAIHGAYWHNRFGTPMSHGCVNLRVPHARWLYSWAPVGTPVVIRR